MPREPPLPGSSQPTGARDNQLASLFARWVVPNTGFEAYGEFGREDHSGDLRDLLQEPDHGGAARMLGFRKMWHSGWALRGEEINFQAPAIKRFRGEGSVYIHSVLRQGHTQRGQLLGADVGVGSGAGSTVAIDRYFGTGRATLFWSRRIGHDTGSYYLTGIDESKSSDILHSIGVDLLRFSGRTDLSAKAILTANLNRHFVSDAYNMTLIVGARYSY